jgi:hypothetical protein
MAARSPVDSPHPAAGFKDEDVGGLKGRGEPASVRARESLAHGSHP